ncbi:MAG: hypothetical protein CSA22_07765 [Deltaproteobacteria bacterium]|nr:MAG: hypothetical protein CSA22_07765 [Deltaproteobacteria bacterium]
MGLFDFFSKKKADGDELLTDVPLEKLKTGYYLDYDMKTWQVTNAATYNWGDADISYEWQLTAADDVIYLELTRDDADEWCITRKVPFGKLGEAVVSHMKTNEDPPAEITFDGVTYYQEEMGGGQYINLDKNPESGSELLRWDYCDDSGDRILSIEQWGENDFEAAVGEMVEAYAFTNILPGTLP